jgi:hypothetical protein
MSSKPIPSTATAVQFDGGAMNEFYPHLMMPIRLVLVVALFMGACAGYYAWHLFRRATSGSKSAWALAILVSSFVIAVFCLIQSSSEQVVTSGKLTIGMSFFLFILAVVSAVVGGVVAKRNQNWGALLFSASSAAIIGNLIGWLWRLSQPSEFGGF